MLPDSLRFQSSPNAPFQFSIQIWIAEPSEHLTPEIKIWISAHTTTEARDIRTYSLRERQHQDYIDFFAAVARDFGICTPAEYLTSTAPASKVEYIPLLTENLTPQICYGYGDPAVIRVESLNGSLAETWYYLTVTSNDAPDAFPILRSRDLRSWEPRGFIFPDSESPGWAATGEIRSDYWAPEIHERGSEFLAYFVARDGATGELCIGMAKSLSPDGPFVPQSDALLKANRIDPHVFAKSDGELYLYWKEDSNGIWPQMLADLLLAEPTLICELFDTPEQQRTATFISTLAPWTVTLDPMERFFVHQPLLQVATADFVQFRKRLGSISEGPYNFAVRERATDILARLVTAVYAQKLDPSNKTLVGAASKVLENDQKWEAHVIEGMWVTEQNGRYYMFYSGNDFSTREYGIGVAVSDSPLGPFEKMPEALLGSNDKWIGPGHPSLATGTYGEPILFFHAYVPGHTGYKQFRALLCVVLDFQSGLPVPMDAADL